MFVPEGKDHRVAGIVLLSFTSETRDSFLALNELPVPANSVYLANMAVDKAFRRCATPQRVRCTRAWQLSVGACLHSWRKRVEAHGDQCCTYAGWAWRGA